MAKHIFVLSQKKVSQKKPAIKIAKPDAAIISKLTDRESQLPDKSNDKVFAFPS